MRLPLSSSYIPKTYNQQSWWQIIHRIIQPLESLADGFLFNTPVTVPVTASYTIPQNVHWIPVDASGGAVTITLRPASKTKCQRFTVKKIDSSANAVTVDGDGSETIDDATTAVLSAQYESICVMSDGSEYWVV